MGSMRIQQGQHFNILDMLNKLWFGYLLIRILIAQRRSKYRINNKIRNYRILG